MSQPAGNTHQVRFEDGTVVKTYRSWHRGEPHREATALAHLHRYAPGVAPQLLGASLDEFPPSIRMSRVAGQHIERPWTQREIDALHQVLNRLWSVPCDVLPPLPGCPAHRIDFWRLKAAGQGPPPPGSAMTTVYTSAMTWLFSADAARLDQLPAQPVLGHGDPRVANLLVDQDRVFLLDFEDAGLSHRAYELANTIEHLGNRGLGLERLADLDDLAQREDVLLCRRLVAIFWFLLLYPGSPAEHRNPPGTFNQQGDRLAQLLGWH